MKTIHTLLSLLLLSGNTWAQSFNIPPPPQAGPVVLKNANIYPVSGPAIALGAIRFEAGKISAIGATVDESGAQVEDLKGLRIYPGLIDANSSVGLFEVDSVRGTVDTAEVGPFNPNVRAQVAINPDSEQFAVARANGLLAALVTPQPGASGILTGTSALVKFDGWTFESMTLKAPVAMHITWPQTNLPAWLPAPVREAAIKAAQDNLSRLETLFKDAESYAALKKAKRLEHSNLRLEALVPAVEGTLPVFFHVHDQAQIRAALQFASKHALRAVLVGAEDAWRVLDLIKAANVPVIIGGTHVEPIRRDEPYDTAFVNPLKLFEAGIPFAIAMQGDTFSTSLARNLPYHAATAASFGLPPDEALKAITLYPAQILGVDDQIGSLAVGKQATFFLIDGDPLEVRSLVSRAFVQGREIPLTNRQSELNRKYTEKYTQPKE